jgi:hypothetical protein
MAQYMGLDWMKNKMNTVLSCNEPLAKVGVILE